MPRWHNDLLRTKILQALQRPGLETFESQAKSLNVNPATFSRHRRKLEREGVIKGYAAILDHEKLGFEITAFLHIELRYQTEREAVIEALMNEPAIQEVFTTVGSGNCHLMAKVRGRKLDEVVAVKDRLTAMREVTRANLFPVGRTVKETMELPL